jgi:hypothetical protein
MMLGCCWCWKLAPAMLQPSSLVQMPFLAHVDVGLQCIIFVATDALCMCCSGPQLISDSLVLIAGSYSYCWP